LAVLFLFGVIAVGGGWYYWTHRTPTQIAGNQDTPTPAPQATTAPVNTTEAATSAPTEAPATEAPPAKTDAPVANTGGTNAGSKGTRAATLPPTSRTSAPVKNAEAGGQATAAPERNGGGNDYSYLDREAEGPTLDGEAAGGRVAGAYSSSQGGGGNAGGYGVGGRLRGRPRSPRNLTRAEMPGVATIRYLINTEEMYKKRNNRYGSLADLLANHAALDVKTQGDTFMRAGYRFELKASKDEFKITAEPQSAGPRFFTGTDSGYITETE
jgi:hypothetical protein